MRKAQFAVRPWGPPPDPARELLPLVDGVSLVDLVSAYERASGFDVPGQYAGLILDHVNFGDLTKYLIGHPEAAYAKQNGVIALLGCDCGELGCWPLEARIRVESDRITWRDFVQPFRPQRDYGTFGPFVFSRTQYERAVRAVSE